ncbi:MAG: holo-[acyl-carrier-protein] synthase [Dehalococcoidia bacterium]|nr:holo-[acyl-carrier-protein] synthase [Dehalococcoidia bacterium]
MLLKHPCGRRPATALTTGVDIVEIERIEAAIARRGERFLRRIFTDAEIALYRDRISELAVRFAAKEATMKALGTGIRGVGWRDIEVLPNRRGKPLLYLHGRARERADALGITDLAISLSHSRDLAIASVVGTMT